MVGFGHRDGPIHYPVPWGSFGAAMQAVAGILGALTVREQTGRGQQLSATMVAGLDPVDYFVSTIAQLMAKRGEEPLIDARTAIGANRYGVLVATSDGRFIQTSTMLPHQGRALTEVAGLAHLLDDPRFTELPRFATAEDAQEWEDALWEAFRQEDLKHWLPLLEASPDVAFEVAATSEEGMEHPQIVHNGDVVTVDDPSRGPIRQVGPIGHFSESPLVVARSAPALDANDGPFTLHPPPAGGGDAPEHPFAGVTIVEFGCFYAMPYGVTMAAALGARVIKIEDGKGDPHRSSFGAEVASNKTTAGKESISLDLRNPQGQEIARRVCAQADVFVTGYRSGVADRLGLGYEELRALNPRLVYMHAAGYGTDGPYAHRALYAQAAQAVAGSFGRQVGYWADPAQNEGMSVVELQAIVAPRLNQVVDGDSNAALEVLAALALAIYHQRRTGRGQFVRTSMISGNAWCYSDDFCTYDGKPPIPLGDSEYYGTGPLDRVYETADGWVCLAVRTQREYDALLSTLGLSDLVTDVRAAATDDAVVAALRTRFKEKSCQRVGVAAAGGRRRLRRGVHEGDAGVHQLRPGTAGDRADRRDRPSDVRLDRARRPTGLVLGNAGKGRPAVRPGRAQRDDPRRARLLRPTRSPSSRRRGWSTRLGDAASRYCSASQRSKSTKWVLGSRRTKMPLAWASTAPDEARTSSPSMNSLRPSRRSIHARASSGRSIGTGFTKRTVSVPVTDICPCRSGTWPSTSSSMPAVQPPWATPGPPS